MAWLGAVGEVDVSGVAAVGQTLGARFIDQVAAAAADRAGMGKTEAGKAEAGKAGTGKAGTGKAGTGKAAAGKAEKETGQ